MAKNLKGKCVAIIATDYFEESELTEPMAALQDAGAAVDVIAPHEGEIKSLNNTNPGQSIPVDIPAFSHAIIQRLATT